MTFFKNDSFQVKLLEENDAKVWVKKKLKKGKCYSFSVKIVMENIFDFLVNFLPFFTSGPIKVKPPISSKYVKI